jgi:hypothetical protein
MMNPNVPPPYPAQPVPVPPPYGYAPPPFAQAGYAAPAGPPLSRPGTVTAASIMWIIYGVLALLGNLSTLAMSGGRTGGPSFVGLGIAVAFLMAGVQALGGKAKGVLGMGVTSIVLGSLVAIAFIALGGIARGFHEIAGLLIVIGLLFGGFLATAGILACVGNTRYKAWRASRGLG